MPKILRMLYALGAKRLFCDKSQPDCLDKVQITTLSTSGKEGTIQPTKENFKKAFEDIAKKAKPEDIIVIYLAGHGVSFGTGTDTYFYLTKEARSGSKEDLAKTFQTVAISSTELTEWLTTAEWTKGEKGIKALKQVLILDTCAAGEAAAKIGFNGKTRPFRRPDSRHRILKRQNRNIRPDGKHGGCSEL